MASNTTNYNLHKIDLTDAPPDITVLNGNWDILDAKIKEIEEGGFDPSVITPESIGAADRVHASQHASGGSDPITPSSIGAVACNTPMTFSVVNGILTVTY